MKILIVHSTFDGQTARIAARMAEVIRGAGHEVADIAVEAPDLVSRLTWSDAVIVGGAIRYGRHSAALEKAVRRHYSMLFMRPNAFFSVCMSAAGPNAKAALARGYIDAFIQRTGWQPRRTESFAGALPWSKYNPFIRFMMRIIVGMAHGDTDTSRDYEYTDWAAVERFAAQFELPLREPQAA